MAGSMIVVSSSFNMISDEIRNAYNPFESCASAQMLIKNERSDEMILSVSRRTDIPNYYSEWFYNRIKEGFLYVRNPMNAHQISEIKITPDVVDCIVFWTKNPLPMIKRLDEIKDYNYYFQFTLTGYGNDVEINLPNKKTKMIPVFQELSEKIGKQKVIWRYDPIFFLFLGYISTKLITHFSVYPLKASAILLNAFK